MAIGPERLDEWMNLMTYMLHVLRKFRGDTAALSRFAAAIVQPFEERDSTFAEWFRAASHSVESLRCVFEGSETCTKLVQQLRLRQLEGAALGDRYRSDMLVLESSADHFALLRPDRVQHHVDAAIAALQGEQHA